jgi:flavocytochrome c
VTSTFMLINVGLFLVYTPEPSTEHYLQVKSVNLTSLNQTDITAPKPKKAKFPSRKKIKFTPDERNNTKFLKLDNGDVLAYEIEGPDTGYPVFQFHDIPGSKSWRHLNESHLLQNYNIKLIRFDRLGIGQSRPKRSPSSAKLVDTINEFLFSDSKKKHQKNSVIHVVQYEFSSLVKHVLTSPDEHYSVIGYGIGAPYALGTLFAKNLDQKQIDSVVLLAPLGYVDKNLINNQHWSGITGYLVKMINMHGSMGELFARILWNAFSKFGFVTHHEMWHRLIKDNINNDDHEMIFGNTTTESDQWRNIFNQTMIDLFMQGTHSIMDEYVRVYNLENMGFALLSPALTQKSSTHLKIFYSNADNISAPSMVDKLFEKVCPDQISTILCEKELIQGVGHFVLFRDKYNNCLEYISQHALRKNQSVQVKQATRESEGMRPLPTEDQELFSKIDLSFLTQQSVSSGIGNNEPVHIIIIGAGLAGLSAAIEASRTGSNVKILMLEKEERCGGNSAKASSGMNAAPTLVQEKYGVHDSVDSFYNDTIKSGGGLSDPILSRTLVERSREALEFLQNVGKVNMDVLSHCGGHTHMRTHRNYVDPMDTRPKNVGMEIISKLTQLINEQYKDKITIVTKAKVIGLIMHNKRVIGVKTDFSGKAIQSLYAHSIILTSGGYGQDREELLAKYAPDWMKNLPSTNGPFSKGDLIKIAQRDARGQLVHMDQIQVHPTGFVNPKDPNAKTVFLAAEALRAYGGLLLDPNGKRFTNELGTRDKVTDDILKSGKAIDGSLSWAFMVINEFVVDSFGRNLMSFYLGKGFFSKHENAEDFAKSYNLSPHIVLETLSTYNGIVEKKSGDPFGKTLFPTAIDPNEVLYVAKITPSIHYTMGGLKFDKNGHVINEDNEVIPGLYAAGEVTGSLHGKNRLAGNSLLETVVYGRICGVSAVNQL